MNQTTTTYTRVIPRDFFNEALLLKCFGQLALKILDNRLPKGVSIEIIESGEPFKIEQDESSGDLFLSNYQVLVNGVSTYFYSPLNCKDRYPLHCIINDEYLKVFDENGNYTVEFEQLHEIL